MARYSVKPGVDMTDLAPEILAALAAAEPLYQAHGVDLVVTAGRDGHHKVGSLHYDGKAVDLRTRDFRRGVAVQVASQLAAALGPDYDVIFEGDHIHVEFDPKGRLI